MLVIAAALTIALVLSAYVVRTITADPLPSQEFIASFTQPSHVRAYVPKHAKPVAQNVGQDLYAVAEDLLSQIDAALAPIRCTTDEEWKRYAEASVTHTPWVPTGREYDALLARTAGAPLYDRLLAAMGMDEVDILGPVDIAAMVDTNAPAKRVRVYSLAQEFGVLSADVRLWLEHECGVATKSASSTVSPDEANRLREWVSTHMDV